MDWWENLQEKHVFKKGKPMVSCRFPLNRSAEYHYEFLVLGALFFHHDILEGVVLSENRLPLIHRLLNHHASF